MSIKKQSELVDRFGRTVNYLRVSVTDRCDFRCVYCMSEDMTFVPRDQILSLEEIYRIVNVFVGLGVYKVRVTGGEPLIRHNVMHLIERLGVLPKLTELVLTTNGSKLSELAPQLKSAGVKRINVSLDSLKPDKFKGLTRIGKLDKVLEGIDVAIDQGFERIKLNSVILNGRNEDEVQELVAYACERNIDISFIEEMPLGNITEYKREETYCSSDEILAILKEKYELNVSKAGTGGPSSYYQVQGEGTRVGLISPHSHNFCGDCNRVRLTAEGRLLLCLGHEHSVDLRSVVRSTDDDEVLKQAIIDAMGLKPEKHEFKIDEAQPVRFMNMTGG